MLCREFGIPVPDSILITSIHPIQHHLFDLKFPLVLKAQVPSHKRARRGGIGLARSLNEAVSMLSSMFTRNIDEHSVNRILIEEMIEFHSGFSISLKYDIDDFSIILAISKSFTSLEENGGKGGNGDDDENEIRYKIDPYLGILDATIAEISALLELESEYWENFKSILSKIWNLFTALELQYLEINPLVVGSKLEFFVLGIDIEFDDRSLFRHPEISHLIEFGPIDEFGNQLSKMGCEHSRFDGKCCIMSTSLEMGWAIRDILESIGHEASDIISLNGLVTADTFTQILQLIKNEKRSECLILHLVFAPIVDSQLIESIKRYKNASQNIMPIIAKMNGLERKSQLESEDIDHLIIIKSLDEISSALLALEIGKK